MKILHGRELAAELIVEEDLLLSELVSSEFANSGRLLGNSTRPVNLALLGL